MERLLRSIILSLIILSTASNADAQDPSAQEGQAFGKQILPGMSGVPVKTPLGYQLPRGETIKESDLLPSKGNQSQLKNAYGNDAAVQADANNAVNQASTDPDEWGEAYRTLDGSVVANPHKDYATDPIWQQTDQEMTNVFTKNFSGCSQLPSTQTTSTVQIPSIKHCVQGGLPATACTITHSLSSTIVPAIKRCDPNTFTTISRTLYNTTNKQITDAISCAANGVLQHNITANTITVSNQTCNKKPATSNQCIISHNYAMAGQTCTQGTYSGPLQTAYVPMWYWYNLPIAVEARPICGAVNSYTTIRLHAWYTYEGSTYCNAAGGIQDITLPKTPVSYRKLTTMPVSFFHVCHQSMDVYYSSTGCNSSNNCSATFEFREYSPSDTSHRGTYTSKSITVNYKQNAPSLVDYGWVQQSAGCAAKASNYARGVPGGYYSCSYDPSGGAYSYNTGSGVISQPMMASPYPGISSLCKTMTVTETIPGVDGCASIRATPGCSPQSSAPASNGGTNFTYSCSTTSTTNKTLSNCGGGACSTNL